MSFLADIRRDLWKKIREEIRLVLVFNGNGYKIYSLTRSCFHKGFLIIKDNNGKIDYVKGNIADLMSHCQTTYKELDGLSYKKGKLFISKEKSIEL